MTNTIQMTKDGHERLQTELEHQRERLGELIRSMQSLLDSALDLEDTSLQAAQQDRTTIEARIVELEDALTRAVVVENPDDPQRVAIGATVLLSDDDNQREMRVHVVSAPEASVLGEGEPRVADDSPVGQAVMGCKKGDTVTVRVGDREVHYTIRSVDYGD